MKYTTIIAVLCLFSTQAIHISGDGEAKPAAAPPAKNAAAAPPAKGAAPAELAAPGGGADPEDAWIVIPKQTVSVKDKDWGKDVQRLGHEDWLDGHVKEIKVI